MGFRRLDGPNEGEDAGFREVVAGAGLKPVGWPGKAAALLPPCDLRVSIAPHEDGDLREACFEAMSATGRELRTARVADIGA